MFRMHIFLILLLAGIPFIFLTTLCNDDPQPGPIPTTTNSTFVPTKTTKPISSTAAAPVLDITHNISNVALIVEPGETVQFSVTVENATDDSVTWSIEDPDEAKKGTIDPETGVYTAPELTTTLNTIEVTIVATLNENPDYSASFVFTFQPPFEMVTDIYEGINGSNPDSFVYFDDMVYFAAMGLTNGREVWRVRNGKAEEAVDVLLGDKSSDPKEMLVYDKKIYGSAEVGFGRELFYFDKNLTKGYVDINDLTIPETGAESSNPQYLTVYGEDLVFSVYYNKNSAQNTALGVELFKYNPASGALIAYPVDPTPAVYDAENQIWIAFSTVPKDVTLFNDKLYFSVYSGMEAGGMGGEELIALILQWIALGVEIPVMKDGELYKWNEGEETISLLTEFATGEDDPDTEKREDNASISNIFVYGSYLYMNGTDGVHGLEPLKCDSFQISMLKDIFEGDSDSDSNPNGFTIFQDKLYFVALTAEFGRELYVYDGVNPPEMVIDLYPLQQGSTPHHLTVFNNKLYFGAIADDTIGNELYSYDGIEVKLVANINDIPEKGSLPGPMFADEEHGLLYVSAIDNQIYGRELWVINKTQ